MDQWMRDFEERQRHDELKQKMDAQTSAMNSQAIALQKQNNILQKEHERQIEKEFKDRIFQLRLHLAQVTDESQQFVIQQMLSEAEEDYENYQREQAEKRLAEAKRRKIWLIISSVVAVLGMAGLYFVYQDISQVTVPELYGIELSEAKAILYEEGLKVGTITEVGGQSVQPGNVSMSSPSGGNKVKRGSSVNLVVAEDTDGTIVVEESSTSEVSTSKTAGSSQASSQSQVGSAVQLFTVDIKKQGLVIRQEPSLSGEVVTNIEPGTYTIVETTQKEGHSWGRLKSGQGWISLTDLHNPVPQVDTKNLTTDQVKAWVMDDLFSRSVMIEKYRKDQVVISVRMAEDGLVYADVTVPSDPNFEPRDWSYRINSRGELEASEYDTDPEQGGVNWYVAQHYYLENSVN
ncbi:TPA: PASTA domain-containing protein [Streptococcus suis]|uniref:PASTA domain-containing protein n=1 Tax=Streptococcus suis TaxID=1307 RepID=UPI00040D635B|nr:PASTA domain-containing protein [Streptococcus suis]UUM56877.1 PASTA domain-containing protein [Streptococcus suis]HEL9634952.1 PASTA domain-containing protein [Streptococcus suis]HEM3194655.1 PASTA domain-containing protein [Streptococcus suis 10581]